MTSEAEKRNLSTSSDAPDAPDDKRSRIDDEIPSWARQLLADVETTKNNTNAIRNSVEDVKNDLRRVKDDVDAMGARILRLELKSEQSDTRIAALEAENAMLTEKNVRLENKIDKTIDDSLRDSLSIHRIPRKPGGGRESWDETGDILAAFLAKNSKQSKEVWKGKISRAHRGKPSSDVIHCLFSDYRWAAEVLELFRGKKGKIGDVFALEKFSIATTDRRNLAQDERDRYRRANPNAKCWIKYPATLMCKNENDSSYNPIKSF